MCLIPGRGIKIVGLHSLEIFLCILDEVEYSLIVFWRLCVLQGVVNGRALTIIIG